MNFQHLPVSISTERLILRKFQTDDLTAYAAYRSRDDVYRYLYAAPSTGAALEEKFAKLLEAPFENDGNDFRLAVTRKEDGALVGDVMLKLANRAALQAEVGYVFHPDFGGRGYATEAVSAMISAGFETFGFHRILPGWIAATRAPSASLSDWVCGARRTWSKTIGLTANGATNMSMPCWQGIGRRPNRVMRPDVCHHPVTFHRHKPISRKNEA